MTFRRKEKYVTFLTRAIGRWPVMKNNLTVTVLKEVEKSPSNELGIKN